MIAVEVYCVENTMRVCFLLVKYLLFYVAP